MGDYGLLDKPHSQVYGAVEMKAIYDKQTDTLTIIFSDTTVAESDEEKPGVILDYDADGNLIALEILNASSRVGHPYRMEYQIVPAEA